MNAIFITQWSSLCSVTKELLFDVRLILRSKQNRAVARLTEFSWASVFLILFPRWMVGDEMVDTFLEKKKKKKSLKCWVKMEGNLSGTLCTVCICLMLREVLSINRASFKDVQYEALDSPPAPQLLLGFSLWFLQTQRLCWSLIHLCLSSLHSFVHAAAGIVCKE